MAERPTKQFTCRYFHDGAWWAINVAAYDWDDAETRARKLGLQLDGEIQRIIPQVAGARIGVRFWTALRNFIHSRSQ